MSDYFRRDNTNEEVSLKYVQGKASGYLVTDRICLDKDAKYCSDDYKMLNVFKGRDLTNLRSSGIVGLSPYSDDRNKNFLDDLKKNNVIE